MLTARGHGFSTANLNMQGGKEGLSVNSRNLCGDTNPAAVKMAGQNGKVYHSNPVVKARCGGKKR